jgi:hypothetical protein
MHRFRSKSVLLRFKAAALLLCFRCFLTPVAILILLYSLAVLDHQLTVSALLLGGLIVLMAILQSLIASRTRCPLCMTPVLSSKGCSKHRNSRKALGSYRLRVALGILFQGSFRCPYCNEPTAMEVRDRRNPAEAHSRD